MREDEHNWQRSLRELQAYRSAYPYALMVPGHDAAFWAKLEQPLRGVTAGVAASGSGDGGRKAGAKASAHVATAVLLEVDVHGAHAVEDLVGHLAAAPRGSGRR